MKQTEQSYGNWYFLLIVIIISIIIFFIKPEIISPTFIFFWSVIKKIILVFIVIFVLLVLINYFVSPKGLTKYLGKNSGFKGYLIAIVTGIISHGPIYMWYPLLNDLQKKGVRNSLIAIFLYNRAIKIPLLPLMIFYFGLVYVIVLSVVMIIMSIFNGMIVEKFLEVKK